MYLSILLSMSLFNLKTHLHPTTFLSFGSSTRSHVLLFLQGNHFLFDFFFPLVIVDIICDFLITTIFYNISSSCRFYNISWRFSISYISSSCRFWNFNIFLSILNIYNFIIFINLFLLLYVCRCFSIKLNLLIWCPFSFHNIFYMILFI